MTEIAFVMVGLVGAFGIGLVTATNFWNAQVTTAERKRADALSQLADAQSELLKMKQDMIEFFAWWQGGDDDDDDGGECVTQEVDIYLN